MGSNRALGESFLAATDSDALRAVCSPHVEIALNRTPPFDLDGLIAIAEAIGKVMSDYHFENVRCSDTEDGFVHERESVGTLADGTKVAVRACVVGTVEDGMITSLREYYDSAEAAAMLAATSPGADT